MEERSRNLEDFTKIAKGLAVHMEESMRHSEERLHLVEESRRRRDELLQRMVQAVAVMPAEIVRIDETHS
jgi:hypothetical protein